MTVKEMERYEVDVTGSWICLKMGFCISGTEPSDFAIETFVMQLAQDKKHL
jgi:hypothetical protein